MEKGWKRKTGMKRRTLTRAFLLSALIMLLSVSMLPAAGAHEAYKRTSSEEFRGSEVFTFQEDGSLPFLIRDDFRIPEPEPGIYGHPHEIVLSTGGIREGHRVTYSFRDIDNRKETEAAPLEDTAYTSDDIFGTEDDLWGEEDDLWGDSDDLWSESDSLWDDEDLWAEDEDGLWGGDPWGDDFWEENWEPSDTGVSKDALMEDDPDFWADFYIAGTETDMALSSGTFYMDIWINDQYSGNIEIVSEDGEIFLDAETFRYMTAGMLDLSEKAWLAAYADRIPLSDLEVRGYTAEIDNIGYVVTMYIPTSALDTVVLSIAQGGAAGRGYYSTRPLANAIEVKNAAFSLETGFSLSMYVPVWPEFDPWSLLSFDLGMSSRLRLFDVYNQFSFGMSVGKDRFSFRFGLYSFYTDFPSAGLRLSWGNISGYGRPAKGTPLGIKLERNASYYDSSWKRQSYVSRELVLDTRSEVIVSNGQTEIFSSVLEMGTYLLEDFILTSGGNDVTITIRPQDGSPERTVDFSVLYGYSLLAPGENYWGLSFSMGREERTVKSPSPFTLSVPFRKDSWLEYDARNFSAGFYFDIGLCRGLTLRTRGSLTNVPTDTVDWAPAFRFDASFLNTNDLGNLTVSGSYWNTVKDGSLFGHNASLSYSESFATGWTPLSSISLAFGYDYGGSVVMDVARHSGRASVSLGGRLGFLNWSGSFAGSMDFVNMDMSTLSGSTSVSFSAGRNVSVSASMSMNGGFIESRPLSTTFRVGVSMYLGGVSSSLSADAGGGIDMRISGGRDGHSASGSVSTNWNSGWALGMSGYYSYSGKYLNLGTGLSSSVSWLGRNGEFAPSLGQTGVSLSLSTSTLFADGLFQIRSAIPHDYLMVRQKGALRGNILTTASGNSASEDSLFRQFGIGTIDGAGGTRDEYLTLYSQSADGQNYHSYNVKLPKSRRNGYILVLEEDFRYTVSGLVPGWYNASSPLYRVERKTDGEGNVFLELANTGEYIFSDETTRFMSPALFPGLYAFDVPVGDGTFRLVMFEIPDLGGETGVLMLDSLVRIDGVYVNMAYSSYERYTSYDTVSMDEYWDILYPSEDDDFFFGEDDYFDDGQAFTDDGLWGESGLWDDGEDSLWSDADDSLWSDTDDSLRSGDTGRTDEVPPESSVIPMTELVPANPYVDEDGNPVEYEPLRETDVFFTEGAKVVEQTVMSPAEPGAGAEDDASDGGIVTEVAE